jgi:D-amino-acid dehydrogenase
MAIHSFTASMDNSSQNESVLVVGAGIIGIACAHYLSRAGFKVTVIDQGTIASACSYGNCGYICPSHILPLTEPGAVRKAIASFFTPQAAFRVKPRWSPAFWNWMWQFARRCNHRQLLTAGAHLKSLLDASMTEFQQLMTEQSLDCEWQESGLLYVLQSASGMREFAKSERLLNQHFGVEARRLSGEELPEFDPALKTGLAGAFHFEGDAFLRPDRLAVNWAEKLKEAGVTFIENCSMQSLEKTATNVSLLETSCGTLRADHFVIAAGAWSTKLAKHFGCRIPIEPGKGYSVTMQRPDSCPRYPMLLLEHHVGVTPFDEGYRLGSMMEFAGFDASIPDRRIQQLRDSATPYLVEPYTDTVQETWYGWRPMTWDSLPIIGRVPRLENAYLATGHNMLGVSLAAVTGRLIAEIVQRQTPHIDITACSPARF